MDETVLYAEALRLSQWIILASTTLVLYDHAINLDNEVKYFWSGQWTFSRVMYFCVGVDLMLYTCNNLDSNQLYHSYTVGTSMSKFSTPNHVRRTVKGDFVIYVVEIIVLAFCQAAITTRVWYLFSHSPTIRTIAVQAFAATTLANGLLAGFLWRYVQAGVLPPRGTETFYTPLIAWLYVPSLLLHSLLFALKLYRFVTSPKYLQRDTFLWRFLKEGMAMYACALGSLLFLVIGLTMTDVSQIPVHGVAISGGIVFVALSIVSTCRAMLSIKSLAATAHVDPGWLLNHAELSRVHWRPGTTEREIIVESSFDLPLTHQGGGLAPSFGTLSTSNSLGAM